MKQHFVNSDEPMFRGWIQTITEMYGNELTVWPTPGCGAKFSPCAMGDSMVAEVKFPSGEWEAFCRINNASRVG